MSKKKFIYSTFKSISAKNLSIKCSNIQKQDELLPTFPFDHVAGSDQSSNVAPPSGHAPCTTYRKDAVKSAGKVRNFMSSELLKQTTSTDAETWDGRRIYK